MDVIDKILEVARSYQGQQEVRGNKGFKVKWFQKLMERMGWKKGQPWCAYLVEAVWKEAYGKFSADMTSELDKLFSASAVQTFKNFNDSNRWHTSEIPVAGALAVWRYYKNGKPTWRGHIGVVEEMLSDNKIKTIDGNTNDGKSREGYIVAPVERVVDFEPKDSGLVMMGFIHPRLLFEKRQTTDYKKIA